MIVTKAKYKGGGKSTPIPIEEDWEVRNDLDTLIKAAEIKRDKKRCLRVMELLKSRTLSSKEIMAEMAEETMETGD